MNYEKNSNSFIFKELSLLLSFQKLRNLWLLVETGYKCYVPSPFQLLAVSYWSEQCQFIGTIGWWQRRFCHVYWENKEEWNEKNAYILDEADIHPWRLHCTQQSFPFLVSSCRNYSHDDTDVWLHFSFACLQVKIHNSQIWRSYNVVTIFYKQKRTSQIPILPVVKFICW
jgi:hypothetical protein